MEGRILKKGPRASGLLELSIGVALAAVFAGAVSWVSMAMIERARIRHTQKDMSAMLEACHQYDAAHGTWPSALNVLDDILPGGEHENPWGKPFVIISGAERCWVETEVPAAEGGRLRLSANRRYGQAARLVYEQRNVYGR